MTADPSTRGELLFSYGTLQQEPVQRATFGRTLSGRPDRLQGYKLGTLQIREAAVVATSGKSHHPIVTRTAIASDCVDGTVLMVTPAELLQADSYEVSDYRRERVVLASGLSAWAYVDARLAQPLRAGAVWIKTD